MYKRLAITSLTYCQGNNTGSQLQFAGRRTYTSQAHDHELQNRRNISCIKANKLFDHMSDAIYLMAKKSIVLVSNLKSLIYRPVIFINNHIILIKFMNNILPSQVMYFNRNTIIGHKIRFTPHKQLKRTALMHYQR